MKSRNGFTLIELVITIVLLAIVSIIGVNIFVSVFRGYFESKVKNFLFLEIQFTVERISRELRNALPNSIRTDGNYLQYVLIKDGFYYKKIKNNKILVIQKDFLNSAKVGDLISIYNLSSKDLYTSNENLQKIYKIEEIEKISQDNYTVRLNKNIIRDSPYNRFYLIDTPVTIYKKNDKLIRCFGYPINSSNGINEGECNVLTNYVQNISFKYFPGNTKRNAIVKINLTLKKRFTTLNYSYEVHLNNVP